jgi:hypothetical protein
VIEKFEFEPENRVGVSSLLKNNKLPHPTRSRVASGCFGRIADQCPTCQSLSDDRVDEGPCRGLHRHGIKFPFNQLCIYLSSIFPNSPIYFVTLSPIQARFQVDYR